MRPIPLSTWSGGYIIIKSLRRLCLFSLLLPVECELALCPEEVDVVLELELEHELLLDVVLGAGDVYAVAQQR